MRSLKHNSAILALLLVAFILTGCGGGPKEPGRYYADDFDFSIKFPEGWEVVMEDDGVTLSAVSPLDSEDDMLYETVSVSVENMFVAVDLDEYFEAVNRVSQAELRWFELEDVQDIRLGNSPAKKAVFSYVEQGETIRSLGYCLVKGRTAYLITCVSDEYSYPAYAAEFAASAESFRFE